MPGNVVRLVFAGDAKDLDKAAASADRSMNKFKASVDSTNAAINKSNGGFKNFGGSLGALPNLFDKARDGALKGGLDLGSQLMDGMGKGVMTGSKAFAGPGGIIAASIGAPLVVGAAAVAGSLLGAAIVGGLGAGLAGIGLMFAAKSEVVQKEISQLGEHVNKTMQRISKPFEKTLLDIIPLGRELFDVFARQFELVAPQLAQALTSFAGFVKVAFEQLAPAIAPISDAFNTLLADLGPKLPGIFQEIAGSLIALADKVRENSGLITGIIGVMLRLISVGINVITWLVDLLNWLDRVGRRQMEFHVWTRDAFLGAANAVLNATQNIISYVSSLPGRILSAVGNLGNLLWSAGRDLVQGMINGISAMIGNLANTAANMAKSALNAAKRALGINSPSKLMMEVGVDYGRGFVKGIDGTLGVAAAAGGNMATQTAQATANVVGTSTPTATPRGGLVIEISGNADNLVATFIKRLVRTGALELRSA